MPDPPLRFQFGTFEADAATGELRREGIRIKLNAQPFQLLLMLLSRPGEILSRDEITRELWPDGTFVDYDHGVNSAINRIREALGDTAGNPRFVQTLARRGYRFVAPVQTVPAPNRDSQPPSPSAAPALPPEPDSTPLIRILATPQDLPKTSPRLVRNLFLLFQLMYLGFYLGALFNLPEIQGLLAPLPPHLHTFTILIVSAALFIPVRAYLLTGVLFHAPGFGARFLTLWPILLLADILWSLSPFLLLHHIDFGVAVACTALLVYSPFAQRSLILMGAAAKFLNR